MSSTRRIKAHGLSYKRRCLAKLSLSEMSYAGSHWIMMVKTPGWLILPQIRPSAKRVPSYLNPSLDWPHWESFLSLRDLGEETVDDRVVRRIGLKPKQAYRSQLLSAVVFPIRKATIDFDTETYFPVSISFVPSSESPAASIVGPNATIRISYKNVRLLETESTHQSFSPPADGKLFEEKAISAGELTEQLPFPISAELLSRHGFDPADGMALVSRDTEHERAYATVQYASAETSSHEEASSQEAASSQEEASSSEDALTPRLTITFGNYVSKNMARRRATFSESGQPASDASLPIKFLDRKKLWEQRFPGIDTRYAPTDAFFEKDGVFWFLSGTGMDLKTMEALAADLLEAEPEAAPEPEQDPELKTE